jgi:hypothetical protein
MGTYCRDSFAIVTNEDRTRALENLGYIRSEAAFLSLAALHSGYFLLESWARRLLVIISGMRDVSAGEV